MKGREEGGEVRKEGKRKGRGELTLKGRGGGKEGKVAARFLFFSFSDVGG